MESIRIGFCGNIGVGKSTVVEAAQKEPLVSKLLDVLYPKKRCYGVKSYPEVLGDPLLNILGNFYEEVLHKKNRAIPLPVQLSFLASRIKRHGFIKKHKGIVLEDRTVLEDGIFAEVQHELGIFSDLDFETYKETAEALTKDIPPPDLLVYLRASPDTVRKRIANRGRSTEVWITQEYLEKLHEAYDRFLLTNNKYPVLVIDAEEDAPFEEYMTKVIDQLARKISSMGLHVTTPGLGEWVDLSDADATKRAIKYEKLLEDYLQNNPTLISVAGNVGLGKTTFSEIIQRKCRINILKEPVEENPHLVAFLEAPPEEKFKYCYRLQMYLKDIRAELRKTGKRGDASYVKDRSYSEDILIFCRQFQSEGILTTKEFNILLTEFQKTNEQLPPADLLVVLKGRPELSRQRVKQRGRNMELDVWTYKALNNLNKWYGNYVNDVKEYGFHKGPVVELPLDKLDIINNNRHMGYAFERIYKALTGKNDW